ncbi:hypothetical protein Nmel_006488 [Mimus melanotis]
MRKVLSKEEQAMLNILQHILSKRSVKYDMETLKRLLRWVQERGIFASPRSVFNTLEWERLDEILWDAMSDGSKETKGLSMVWKVIITVLRQLKAERTARSWAAAVLEPDDPVVAFLGEDTVSPSLPSAPPEIELQAQQEVSGSNSAVLQSMPEPEKMEIDTPLPLPAPGLLRVSPEELTVALGGQVYAPLPPSLPDLPELSYQGNSNGERSRCSEEEEHWRQEKELAELMAIVDQQIRGREKNPASNGGSKKEYTDLPDRSASEDRRVRFSEESSPDTRLTCTDRYCRMQRMSDPLTRFDSQDSRRRRGTQSEGERALNTNHLATLRPMTVATPLGNGKGSYKMP